MEKVWIHGLMDPYMKVNGRIIKLIVLVHTDGSTEESILECGWIIICMVKEHILGRMAENI